MSELIVYEAKDGWRWRLKRSGRIIAESGEAYKRKPNLEALYQKLTGALDGCRWLYE